MSRDIEEAVKALWAVVDAQPTEWFNRLGIVVREDGVLCEVQRSAAEMGRDPGTPYLVPIPSALIEKASQAYR